MKRREFIALAGGAAATWPLAARAQQPAGRVYRVGCLVTASREQQLHLLKAFEEGLRSLGYRVGENVVIEYRFANGEMERLPALAADLVRLGVDIIVTGGNPITVAAMKATTTIPIVMTSGVDPVSTGLVASLARPGGNVTGLTADAGGEILGKRFELLKETLPNLSRVGILFNPDVALTRSPFEEGLRSFGYHVGENVVIEYRFADGELDRVPALAAILTAARSGEVMGAWWDEIDLDGRLWTIPAPRMKGAREHRVPLSRRAVQIVKAMQKLQGSEFVFPGSKPNRPLSVMALEMVIRRAKVDATVHGFRSSFRDWSGERTSFPRDVAEAALAHLVGDETERAYRRGDALEKRRSLMDAWASFCDDAERGKVVTFTGGKRAHAKLPLLGRVDEVIE